MKEKTLLFLMFCFPLFLSAATFTVNSTTDNADNTPGDGICADASGNCTLRAAYEEAAAIVGADIIVLSKATYTLNSGLSNLGDDLTIQGNGATVEAGATGFRFIRIESGSNLTINGFTIQNFAQTGSSDGGAIRVNNGSLTATNCLFNNNSTSGSDAHGGAIAVKSNDMATLTNCTFIGNQASSSGGAIEVNNSAICNITKSTFVSNTNSFDGMDVSDEGGGAISVDGGGTCNIAESFVSDNIDNAGPNSNPDVEGIFASSNNNLVENCTGATGFAAAECGGAYSPGSLENTVECVPAILSGIPSGFGAAFTAVVIAAPVVTAPIPTMNQWGLMIFALLILNLSIIFLYKREVLLS